MLHLKAGLCGPLPVTYVDVIDVHQENCSRAVGEMVKLIDNDAILFRRKFEVLWQLPDSYV